jgi:nucleoside 2-deoxyribosyltransferase
MEGLTKEQMEGWRVKATNFLVEAGVSVLDPCRRIPFHNGPRSANASRRIFQSDLMDIRNSQIFMADIRKKQGTGTGTSMELMYAYTLGKPIILWADEEDAMHPFYEAMYTEKHFVFQDVLNSIVAFKY